MKSIMTVSTYTTTNKLGKRLPLKIMYINHYNFFLKSGILCCT